DKTSASVHQYISAARTDPQTRPNTYSINDECPLVFRVPSPLTVKGYQVTKNILRRQLPFSCFLQRLPS
ncbi:hypothetical protein TNCV_1820191, partial [Trichonephila clavipes]